MSLTSWRAAFIATALIEVPIVVAATGSVGRSTWGRAAVAFVAQWLTHPLVWFVFPTMTRLSSSQSLLLSELWAWLVEAALYALVLPGLSRTRSLAVSALANGASLGFGVVVTLCGAGG